MYSTISSLLQNTVWYSRANYSTVKCVVQYNTVCTILNVLQIGVRYYFNCMSPFFCVFPKILCFFLFHFFFSCFSLYCSTPLSLIYLYLSTGSVSINLSIYISICYVSINLQTMLWVLQVKTRSLFSSCNLTTQCFHSNYLFHAVYLSICLSICLSVCLYVYLYSCLVVQLSICLSVYMSICLSVQLSICLYVYLFICLSDYLAIWLSFYLSNCISVYLSICLSVYLSTCLSVYNLTISL